MSRVEYLSRPCVVCAHLADVVTAREGEGDVDSRLADHAGELAVHLLEELAQGGGVDLGHEVVPRPLVERITLDQHADLAHLQLLLLGLVRARQHFPVTVNQHNQPTATAHAPPHTHAHSQSDMSMSEKSST